MRRRQPRHSAILIMAAGLAILPACDRGSDQSAGGRGPEHEIVELPENQPRYSFAPGLASEYPEVVGFMRQFLETCLAGDYTEYRRLVSRAVEPESRARFEKVLHALHGLNVSAIEPIDVALLPTPSFLVTGKIDLLPEGQAAWRKRGAADGIAILVFKEDGEWRMMIAPSELQPPPAGEADSGEPATVPTTTAPSYPWQEDADY